MAIYPTVSLSEMNKSASSFLVFGCPETKFEKNCLKREIFNCKQFKLWGCAIQSAKMSNNTVCRIQFLICSETCTEQIDGCMASLIFLILDVR